MTRESTGAATLSVVVPCYNEEEVIDATARRLLALADQLTDIDTELIFVATAAATGRCRCSRPGPLVIHG